MGMRRLLSSVAVFAFLFACAARGGALVDAATLDEVDIVDTGEGATNLYSSVENPASDIYAEVKAGDALTIGSSGTSPEGVGATFTLGWLGMRDGSAADIVAAAGAQRGTVVIVDVMQFNTSGAITVRSGVDAGDAGKNRLVINTFHDLLYPTTTGLFSIKENAVLEIRDPALKSNYYTYALENGELSFAGTVTLDSGAIRALSGDNRVAAAAGVILNNTDAALTGPPTVHVADNAVLTLLKTPGGTELGDLTVGNKGLLDIQGSGILNAGTVRFAQDYDLDAVAAQSGTVNAERLEFASLEDAAGLDWRVRDTVSFSGTYRVKGDGNLYAGGMAITGGGVLTADAAADTAISLGTAGARAELRVDGGTIRSAGHEFAINHADIVLVDAPAGAVLDAATGSLDLSQSALIVDAASPAAVMAFDAAGGIVAGTYEQRSGIVEASGPSGGFAVLGQAVIGGGAAETIYRAGSDAGYFHDGLEVRDNGVLAGAAGDAGVVGLGGDLRLTGGGALDGAAGVLTLADPSGQAKVLIGGENNVVRGTVSTGLGVTVNSTGMALALEGGIFETGSFLVESGGVSATQAPATIRNIGGGGNVFRVARDGVIETRSASLSLLGYDGVAIDGVYVAGWDGAGIATLYADSDIVLGATAGIGFTDELLANIQPGSGAVVMEALGAGNGIVALGELNVASIFGTVGMEVSGGALAVTSLENRIAGDNSAADIALATANLRRMWGGRQISSGLGELAYGASVTPSLFDAEPGSAAGEKNVALLRALANPGGKSMGKSTVEYMNGAHLGGVTEAASRTAAAVHERIGGRAREVRGELGAIRDAAGSEEALAALVAGEDPANRFWLAGTRIWDDVGGRDGFSGYEYDAHGFVMGYDRVLSGNIALGVSFAYNSGDYADDGALAHASEITGYTASAYGVYGHESGWYASAAAGYTWFDNDIRELRRDPSAADGYSWAEAEYHGGTWALGIEAGFDYSPCDYLTLTPSFGLLYVHSSGRDHDAYLGDVATQRERDVAVDALLFPLRLEGRYALAVGDEWRMVLAASLGYTFNAIRSGVGGTVEYYGLTRRGAVPVRGRGMGRHSVALGFGVRFMHRMFDFGLDYGYMGGSGYRSHRVAGSVGALF